MSETKKCAENKTCPSYESGECVTYPTPYSVKCENAGFCKWRNTDFSTPGLYENFVKEFESKKQRKKK